MAAAQHFTILALCGSLRKESANSKIIAYLTSNFQQLFRIEVYGEMAFLPIFNPDLDTTLPPGSVQRLRSKIARAHGILICTPEYVFSLPACLKNILEWNVSNTFFLNKPVALITAASSGDKVMEALELIMETLGAHLGEKGKLVIRSPKVKIDGDAITHRGTREDLEVLMNNFHQRISAAYNTLKNKS